MLCICIYVAVATSSIPTHVQNPHNLNSRLSTQSPVSRVTIGALRFASLLDNINKKTVTTVNIAITLTAAWLSSATANRRIISVYSNNSRAIRNTQHQRRFLVKWKICHGFSLPWFLNSTETRANRYAKSRDIFLERLRNRRYAKSSGFSRNRYPGKRASFEMLRVADVKCSSRTVCHSAQTFLWRHRIGTERRKHSTIYN